MCWFVCGSRSNQTYFQERRWRTLHHNAQMGKRKLFVYSLIKSTNMYMNMNFRQQSTSSFHSIHSRIAWKWQTFAKHFNRIEIEKKLCVLCKLFLPALNWCKHWNSIKNFSRMASDFFRWTTADARRSMPKHQDE